jgi:hypothetical protein
VGDVPRADEVPVLRQVRPRHYVPERALGKELKSLTAGTLRSRTRRFVLEKWDELEGWLLGWRLRVDRYRDFSSLKLQLCGVIQ